MVALFDTHCHLNDENAFPDPDSAVAEARVLGVSQIAVIGCDLDSSRLAVQIAERNEGVTATVGWHPSYVATYDDKGLAEIKDLAQHPKVVAIGEIGLDYHRGRETQALQYRALYDQLSLASDLGLPMVFHSRDAYDDLLEVLEKKGKGQYLLHCFGGDSDQARRGLDLGCLIGVDGPVTYKNADALRETLRQVPLESLLIETDAPWLTPHPHRGKPNHPKYVRLVAEGLARTIGSSIEEVARRTTANARRFYRLD